MALTLPRATDSRGKVTSNLRSSREEWRRNCQRRRECEDISSRTSICANVVFISSKLSAFRGNTLEVFLSWCICIANLKKETLFTNGLAMELLDYLLTDLTGLKSEVIVSLSHD